MGLSFKSVGVYTSGGAPEADPNVAAPLADRVYEVPEAREQGERSTGVRFYFKLAGGSGTPTLDVRVWFFDEANNNWVEAITITGIGERIAVQSSNVAPARVTFRVVAEAGSFTSAEFFAAAL